MGLTKKLLLLGMTIVLLVGCADPEDPENKAPVAVNDGPVSVVIMESIQIDVLANDTDDNNDIDANTIKLTQAPTIGSALLQNGKILYTADSVAGDDNFKYTVKDGDGVVSNEAEVSITIHEDDNIAPITTVTPPGGMYGSEQIVSFSVNEPATTYYTTDGSTPSTSSTVYSSSFTISSDTTLSFFSVDTAGNIESVKTAVYTVSISPPVQHRLTVNKTGDGTVVSSPAGGRYSDGTVVTLTATPDPGWQFDVWSGDLSGSANPVTIVMDSDKTVSAVFTEILSTQFMLTTNTSGNGSVSPVDGAYDAGTVVSLTAIPDTGSLFDGWSGDLSGNTNPETITIDADKTVTAAFIPTTTGGTYYHVGPGQSLTKIGDVPWATLEPGDRVYIYWKSTPYKEKWVLARRGTINNRIEIVGVNGPDGQKPVIDGENAVTVDETRFWNEERGVLKIGGSAISGDLMPAYITIDNLEIRGGHIDYQFTDSQGNDKKNYADNSAAIYIEKGADIIIKNCTITDSGNGIFIGQGELHGKTRNILIEHNYIYDNGVKDSDKQHNSYTSAFGITFQYNHYGYVKDGSKGNNLKDRSAGTVIRYNWIEGGSRQLDLVDATNFPEVYNDPSYKNSYVYGNILIENEKHSNYTMIHYGGDSTGTDDYRKGTLYLYNNTMISTREHVTVLVNPSTVYETIEAFNNIFYAIDSDTAIDDDTDTILALMSTKGTVNISNNWFNKGWKKCYCDAPGVINDAGGNLVGTNPMFENFSNHEFGLSAGSGLINKGRVIPDELLPEHNVSNQYVKHSGFISRPISGSPDIGAFENGSIVTTLPVITTAILDDAVIDEVYHKQLAHTGSQSPFTWSISSGSLPDGLRLNGLTGAISGTPTDEDNSSFTVLLADNDGSTDSKDFVLNMITKYTLTTGFTGDGTVSPFSGSFEAGTAVTLTATPVAGWQFDGWSEDLSESANPDTIIMDADKTVTADFTRVPGKATSLLINFGSTSEENEFGYLGWDRALTDVYTNNVDIGHGGVTITVGSNGSYNYQGVSGVPEPSEEEDLVTWETFAEGERVLVTWYNNTGSPISFTPYISFNDSNRRSPEAPDTPEAPNKWHLMSLTELPAYGMGISEFVFDDTSAGEYSLVNVNSNYDNHQSLICDKIELEGV